MHTVYVLVLLDEHSNILYIRLFRPFFPYIISTFFLSSNFYILLTTHSVYSVGSTYLHKFLCYPHHSDPKRVTKFFKTKLMIYIWYFGICFANQSRSLVGEMVLEHLQAIYVHHFSLSLVWRCNMIGRGWWTDTSTTFNDFFMIARHLLSLAVIIHYVTHLFPYPNSISPTGQTTLLFRIIASPV